MEKWEVLFMAGSGIYLILLGTLMTKNKDVSRSKSIGIYNIFVGVLSIVGGIAGYFMKNIGNKIFSGFTILLVISFIIFYMLKIVGKRG